MYAVRPMLVALTPAIACSLAVAAGPEPKMSYLDNGTLRVGVNLNAGGATTYLPKSGVSTNLVNNWDWGRQIQMSHYSGPVPFEPNGKKPFPQWAGLGWNPVQAGDHCRNASKIFWKRFDDERFTENKAASFEIKPDAEFHVYEIDLSASPEYRDAITGLRFDPMDAGNKGERGKVRSISLSK